MPLAPGSLNPPAILGRHLVVGHAGIEVPPAWQRCDRIYIDRPTLDDPLRVRGILDRIRSARSSSESLVIVISADAGYGPDALPQTVVAQAPYELGPRFCLDRDDLHHLVWSQSIDGRAAPHYRWDVIDRAVRLGARLPRPEEPGDLVLPDGEPVWVDAGPLRRCPPIGGVAVLSAVAIDAGQLSPPRNAVSPAELAPDQRRAVEHSGSTARVIAPAGSGKTRVLTERARHLIREWGVPASTLTVLAFNRRAQVEVRGRTSDLADLQVRTLNSVALALLNGAPPFAPQPRRLETIGEVEVRRLLSSLVDLPRRRNTDPLAVWIEALSQVRLGLSPPAKVEELYDGEVPGLVEVVPAFEAALARRGAVDFDGQISGALRVLLTDPVARQVAQRVCRVLLVDEFQDLTPAHVLLIRLLAGAEAAVFAVGDDDQTIYGYNGADPAWLIDFADLFPGAEEVALEVNYRCPPALVEVVERLVRHNRRRVPKSVRPAPGRDPRPQGWSRVIGEDPVAHTVDRVTALIDQGLRPESIAVLTRVNALLAPVHVALVERGVPVQGPVGPEFLERPSVRAVCAWLRLAEGRFAAGDLAEALRRPSRPLHPRCVSWVSEQSDIAGLYRLAGRLRDERESDRVRSFAADIERLSQCRSAGGTVPELVQMVVREFGLDRSLTGLDEDRRGMNRASQSDDVTALGQLAALHRDPRDFERWLRGHLAHRADSHGVELSTVHRVKGQEWPQVIVHHAAADQFPHRLAHDIEEERRLFHVALTRAQDHVTIVTGPAPTEFLAELTTEPPDRAAEPELAPLVAEAVAGRRTRSSVSGDRPNAVSAGALSPTEERAVASLRAYRARVRGAKPAYVIFNDATMLAIARALPTTRGELAAVPGIGPSKLELHGTAVLEIIQHVLDEAGR